MSSLELINIGKKFVNKKTSAITALDKVSFQVENNDFVVIVGPSGSGKSTLLRIISGLEKSHQGEVYLNGALMNNTGSEQRNITLVSQSFSLYPHMTVFENIAFPLKMRKIPPSEITERVNQAAKMMGIDFLISRKPRALSLGQCQRTAIARSIVRYPNIFLFDEPLCNLDASTRTSLKIELAKIHSELNTAFIYVTHDIREAMSLATKLVILDKGKLLQIGSPDMVFNRPACLRVAEYVSDYPLNIISAHIKIQDTCIHASTSYSDIILPSGSLPKNCDNKQITLGIRANDFSFTNSSENAHFDGTISKKEFIGKSSLLTIDTASGSLKVLSSDSSHCVGSSIFLLANNTKILFFDSVSGNAI